MAAAADSDRPSLSVSRTIENLAYGPHGSQKLDLYLPKDRGADTPLLVIVHGGGWAAGDKAEASDMAKALSECSVAVDRLTDCEEKLAVANLNYRLVGKYGVSWQDQIADIGSALSFLAGKSQYYGYSAEGFVLLGMSAGGHLSLLYAYKYDGAGAVKAVVSLAGPTDVSASDLADTLWENFKFDIASVFPKTEHEAASPVLFASHVPTLLMHGKLDQIVPYSQAEKLDAALTVKGVPHKFIHFDDTDHSVGGNADDATINHFEIIFSEILSWIENCAL
ncbi:MAG: alpha/beta hydrolase [Chitinispirillaceae bacterium]|nr:alpha/beta hydrolase [Chitinispirillaceae bacterium]